MIDRLLQDKINDSFNSDFLGNTLSFSDEEKSKIYDEVGLILRRVGGTWGETIKPNEYMAVVTALVELTKEWDSDEDSWLDFVSKKLLGAQGEIRGKTYNQVCNCIDELCRKGKVFLLDCYTKKYYTSVCCHAFSPKSSLFSFFDLCWEIYCKDLFQQYSANDPILNLIVESLRKKFSLTVAGTDEDITIGSKAYSLRAGIKGLALIQDQSHIVWLLNRILYRMHSFMNSEPVNSETYLDLLLQEWWRQKESSFGLKTERRISKKAFVATDYSQIKPRFILENSIAKVFISPIRLCEQFDCEPYIEIRNHDKIVVNEPIPTFGSGVVMTTKEVEYPLDSLVDESIELSIRITHGSNIIFQSQQTLWRDYIVFCGTRETFSQSLLPGTYFLYTMNIKNLKVPADIHRISKNLYSIASEEGDVIRSLEKIVFFEKEKSQKDLFFTANEKRDILYKKGDILYKLIDGDLILDVNKDYNISDLGVRYDGGAFKLSDFCFTDNNDRRRFIISMLAEPGEAVTISVFRFRDNFILDVANIIKFKNIAVSYDKPLYYGDNLRGLIHFKTERYDLTGEFDILDEEHNLSFKDGELIFNPPVLRWRIDQADWNITPNETLYYKNISNSAMLEIDMPLDMDCMIGLTNGSVVEPEKNKKIYKIGQIVYSLDENCLSDGTITVFAKINKSFFEITRVYLHQSFSAEPIFVNSEKFQVEWLPASFVGESNPLLTLQILDSTNTVVEKRKVEICRQVVFCFDFLEENYYTAVIYLESKGFLVKKTELFRKKILLGNIKNLRFKNKILRVSEAMFFNKSSSERIRPLHVADIKYLGQKEGSDYYSGKLFIYNKLGERKYIDYITTPQGKRIKINPIRLELKTLSSCYIGYGLFEDDPDFEFDSEFVIDYDGKTTVKDCGGTKPRYVDYFVFEV